MKANELRIGNFVTIDNEEFHPKIKNVPLEVTQILQCESLIRGIWTYSVSLEFINKKKNVYYEDFGQFIKYIEPIPLTEEWLLKFGFEKVGKTIFLIGNFKITLKDNVFSFYTYHYQINLKSIHQLQNLYFALTGEELTI